jgi:hypothetical protein
MEDYCAAVDALNVRDASTAQRDGVAKFLGWKFVTCLTQLPYFNVIDSVVEDFLHRLSLGVCASLVAATFGYKNRCNYLLLLLRQCLYVFACYLHSFRVSCTHGFLRRLAPGPGTQVRFGHHSWDS